MKLFCPACGQIAHRDMRIKGEIEALSKRGYRGFCNDAGRYVYLKIIDPYWRKKSYGRTKPRVNQSTK